MQNIEFKAELRDIEAARAQCAALGATREGAFRQRDTYYQLSDGRLKKREEPQETAVWIYYHRPDLVRPRMSNYTILTSDQARLRWGVDDIEPWLAVEKVRELWLLDNVRIHLDVVEGLGLYVEFEAIVSRDHDVEACHRAIARLRTSFEPILGEPISASYSDLVAAELGV
jgi:adenylate cyclase class IV